MWLGTAAAGTVVSDCGHVFNCLCFLWPHPRLSPGKYSQEAELSSGALCIPGGNDCSDVSLVLPVLACHMKESYSLYSFV